MIDKKFVSYWVLTVAEVGVSLYESTSIRNLTFPDSETPKILGLATAVVFSNIIFRGLYKNSSRALFFAAPLGLITAYEISNFMFDKLHSSDIKVLFGTVLATLFVNLLNKPKN